MTSKLVPLILVLLLSACVSTRETNEASCQTWDVTDKPTDGLVSVKSDLFATLKSLAPPNSFEASKICWYQKPSGNLEGYPQQKSGYFDIGYEFARDASGWKFIKRNEYVVLSHTH
jgi:hypothetical protein